MEKRVVRDTLARVVKCKISEMNPTSINKLSERVLDYIQKADECKNHCNDKNYDKCENYNERIRPMDLEIRQRNSETIDR